MSGRIGRLATGVLAAWLCLAGAPARAEVAFVEMSKIFEGYYRTRLAEQQLREDGVKLQEQRETLARKQGTIREEFNGLRLEAQQDSLKPEEREQKRQTAEAKLLELQQAEKAFQDYERDIQQQLTEKAARMRGDIVDRIRKAAEEVARARNYSGVIDVSGNSSLGISPVLFWDSRHDLTEAVLETLNKGQKMEE